MLLLIVLLARRQSTLSRVWKLCLLRELSYISLVPLALR